MASTRTALISVADKSGLVPFARGLVDLGYGLIATDGTVAYLREAGLPASPVSELTGAGELLGGRVKTLHPKLFGGVLARRDDPAHLQEAREAGLALIDLVVVNLYPFESGVHSGKPWSELADLIDIGGPSLIRAAAKNWASVGVLADPTDYAPVLDELRASGGLSDATRAGLALMAFQRTAAYDAAIASALAAAADGEPPLLAPVFGRGFRLRYGENPHQEGLFYPTRDNPTQVVAGATQLHGRAISYNNCMDIDAAVRAAWDLRPAVGAAVVKHTNPCGYATGPDAREALETAWAGDPQSAWGSIVACNAPLDEEAAEFLRRKVVHGIIAPDYEGEALGILRRKSANTIVLAISSKTVETALRGGRFRSVLGGALAQRTDCELASEWRCVTSRAFPVEKRPLAEFALRAVKHLRSNAVVVAREYARGFFQLLGMGAGQPNRVDAIRKLAAARCRQNLEPEFRESSGQEDFEAFFYETIAEAVLASDAFFPFADNVEAAHAAGLQYLVQPGGSQRDAEVIASADELGLAMVFTGTRHFLH